MLDYFKMNCLVSNVSLFLTRRGIHGMFPLHLAVLYGFSDCCRKLLSSGLTLFHICATLLLLSVFPLTAL